jgi:hypothetical protein
MPAYSVHTIINDTPFSVITNLSADDAYKLAIRPEVLGTGWVSMLKFVALKTMENLQPEQFLCVAHTIDSGNPNDHNEQILIVRQPEPTQ